MNNSEYWANRFKLMEEALNDRSEKYVENLEKQFDIATAQLDTQIRAWYQRFVDNNGGMTYADAQKLLTSGELEEFKWSVERYIEIAKKNQLNKAWAKQLENASARVHISRLESIKMQIRQLAEELTQSKIDAVTQASKFAYTESYYHTAFEVQRGIGFGWTMQEINTDLVKKVLSKPWTADNQTFTARCWTDKSKLVESVNRELTIMAATGEAPDKAIKAISKQFNVSKSNAGRLVMTESVYFSSAAQKDCFNNLGVEQYEIIGTLDTSACAACGGLDGKVFSMSDFKPGTTAPPFHPRCRCCTAPYFEDMEGVGERAARDAETGKTYYVPSDMKYNDWKESFVGNKQKENLTEADKKDILTYDEEYAIKKYMSSSSYSINSKLREQTPLDDEDKLFMKALDDALTKLPMYNGDIVRTMEIPDEDIDNFINLYRTNEKVHYAAYTSFSTKEGYSDTANVFIRILNSKQARDMTAVNVGESEVLYERDAEFTIKKVERINGRFHILLEEI